MVHINDGQTTIDYSDFENLRNQGGWSLSIGMKDNWDVKRHLDYICELNRPNADASVLITIDSDSLKLARVIDIFIMPKHHDATPKHIQFIKTEAV